MHVFQLKVHLGSGETPAAQAQREKRNKVKRDKTAANRADKLALKAAASAAAAGAATPTLPSRIKPVEVTFIGAA
jgi:hypothetical protein